MSPRKSNSAREAAAAQWLARRDRGLTCQEQDAYLQWLREDPANGAEIARLEHAWSRLDGLRDHTPAADIATHPDLLAHPAPATRWLPRGLLAAAAALVLGAATWWMPFAADDRTPAPLVQSGPGHLALEDGSRIELNSGAEVSVQFSGDTRRVQLVRGEAHFLVARDATRPFVVAADQLTVRAIGTAFTVQRQPKAVSVLVTEGNVQLADAPSNDPRGIGGELSRVAAGQQALVRADASLPPTARVQLRTVTPAELEHALAWQRMRLDFVDRPLRDVATQFNRYNSRRLLIADDATGAILIGGSFRADNLDTFVRLLDLGFGVSAEPHGNDLLLRHR